MVNIFSLFPESNPVNIWMKSNEILQDENNIVSFVELFLDKHQILATEDFIGYYDLLNVQNFLADFSELEDLYPNPAFRLIRSTLSSFHNWREDQKEDLDARYTISQQQIRNHTFPEIYERAQLQNVDKVILLNHDSHHLGEEVALIFKNQQESTLSSINTLKELHKWFIKERIPARNFQITPKHGENRSDVRVIRDEVISPLKCSRDEGFELLKSAVGLKINELFYWDPKHNNYITFRYEGKNPQNMFHGYHLEEDSNDIPKKIKGFIKKLKN